MPPLRSRTTTVGRNAAGARSLWRATGLTDSDFGKPIVAIANSYTQFVPGHVHLKDMGEIVAESVRAAGGVAREFHTIAVDDGIAMGHGGMLYSLPSREIIADSVEYMANAHTADALVCISNCDKITPGMLNAAMRLNIPTVFVSGGPMEAGKAVIVDGIAKAPTDLITAISASANDAIDDAGLSEVERSACPTCGSCSGMFTANSMNCLTEALGLALPMNGTLLATHSDRGELFKDAGRQIVEITRAYYEQDDASVLPRSIATKTAFENAMSLDIAMGGSTNTILHLLAAAREGGVDFTLADIDRISRCVPTLCKVAPASAYHMEDVHRAGGVMAILAELKRAGLVDGSVATTYASSLDVAIDTWDIRQTQDTAVHEFYSAAAAGVRSRTAFSQNSRYESLDLDREQGCIRSREHAYNPDGGLAVLTGNLATQGCIVKTAAVPAQMLRFEGPARIFESQDAASAAARGLRNFAPPLRIRTRASTSGAALLPSGGAVASRARAAARSRASGRAWARAAARGESVGAASRSRAGVFWAAAGARPSIVRARLPSRRRAMAG